MDRAKVPPIINCKTISQKDNRILVWLHKDHPAEKANVYAGVATSIQDYLEWKDRIPIVALILMDITDEDFQQLQKHKVNLFVSQAVFAKYSRDTWVSLQVSIAILEEFHNQFAIIQTVWDGTLADAVACITMMLHYNHLILQPNCTLSALRQKQFASNGIKADTDYKIPVQIWYITQYFVHKNTKRQREIRQCLKNNMANPLIDKVVLLNEEDLKYEWSSARHADKVKQEIIKKRLTYADLLKYTYDSVPPNTVVIFANADIYCNETLKHLWGVNMHDKLFALLRYDEQEDGGLRLFGPRPDSQDTWICLSDSIKSRTWNYPTFEYKLGTAGCDNRFTGDMFGMRFLIANPCQSIQTIHLHNTAIRDYNPKDIVPAKLYMYIHPCAIVEIDQKVAGTTKLAALSPRSTSVTMRGLNTKKLQTYCTMLARENRFKWSDTAPNVTEAKPLQVYHWKDSFVSNCGVVYDYKNVYMGPVETSNAFTDKLGRDIGISFMQPGDTVDSMLAIPTASIERYTNVDLYCLYYISYVLQIYAVCPNLPSIFMHTESLNTLKSFVIRKDCPRINAVAWNPTNCVYAKDIYGFIPEVCEVSTTEIAALRSAFSLWQEARNTKCVVLVDEILTPEFIRTSIEPLLPFGWTVEQVLRTTTGIQAYMQLVGAGLCILYNLPKQDAHWAKLWTLPKGCPTLEFQNELKVEGGFQHLAAAAELDCYCIPLHKGTPNETRIQVVAQFKAWLEKGLLKDASPVNRVVAAPTDISLSL